MNNADKTDPTILSVCKDDIRFPSMEPSTQKLPEKCGFLLMLQNTTLALKSTYLSRQVRGMPMCSIIKDLNVITVFAIYSPGREGLHGS